LLVVSVVRDNHSNYKNEPDGPTLYALLSKPSPGDLIGAALHLEQLSAPQRSRLNAAVAQPGDGLDWSKAAKRDLEALRGEYTATSEASAALNRITSSYVAAMNDETLFAQPSR
jgi:hypothetical protein